MVAERNQKRDGWKSGDGGIFRGYIALLSHAHLELSAAAASLCLGLMPFLYVGISLHLFGACDGVCRRSADMQRGKMVCSRCR